VRGSRRLANDCHPRCSAAAAALRRFVYTKCQSIDIRDRVRPGRCCRAVAAASLGALCTRCDVNVSDLVSCLSTIHVIRRRLRRARGIDRAGTGSRRAVMDDTSCRV